MTRMVWKYLVEEGLFMRKMPKGAQVLSAHIQRGQPQMWVLVNPDEDTDTEERQFVAIGTGHRHEILDLSGRFIGTYVYPSKEDVYHLFEIRHQEGE